MDILVSGSINIETAVGIDRFPLEYFPVSYAQDRVSSTVSGVGVNLSKALRALGDGVRLLGMTGLDPQGRIALSEIMAAGIDARGVLALLRQTPQSVVLYEASGRRQIHTDLKDLKSTPYPVEDFERAASGVRAALMCNIEFNRRLLGRARERGIPVLTDVHTVSDPRDDYNSDFMAAADILFLSDEGLWAPPEECARELLSLYGMKAVVIGRGGAGALLAERGRDPISLPAVSTRQVINTVGAGDSLFSAFAHHWLSGMEMEAALRRAIVFASWKIGARGAAEGFLDAGALDRLCGERGC